MARILLIDDSGFQRKLVRNALVENGHECVEAADGKAGLDKLQEENVDLVVTDLLMPGMNGIEFLTVLKDNGHSVPAIVLTSDVQASVRSEYIELGAKAFLNKPLGKEELEAAVEGALS